MSHTSEIRELAVAQLDQLSRGTRMFAVMRAMEMQAQIANSKLKVLSDKDTYDKQNSTLTRHIAA